LIFNSNNNNNNIIYLPLKKIKQYITLYVSALASHGIEQIPNSARRCSQQDFCLLPRQVSKLNYKNY
jgi:hypothetical protein